MKSGKLLTDRTFGRSVTRTAALFSCVFVLSLLLYACGKEPTLEQQIIASLESMEADAEEGNFMDFMKQVSKDFKGQKGALGRQDFQRFMLLQVNENRRVQANFFPIRVAGAAELTGDAEATATFKLLVTGGQGILPERGQLLDVSTGWIKEGGDWLLLSADWEVAKPND